MSTFTLAISRLTNSNLPWFMDLTFQFPMQYCSLQHQSNLASITSPIHNWVLFLLWLHPFFLSGVISPLISNSILGTYRPGEFIIQCPIFLPFHTVHEVLKARILKKGMVTERPYQIWKKSRNIFLWALIGRKISWKLKSANWAISQNDKARNDKRSYGKTDIIWI